MYVGGTVVLIREYNPLAFLETVQRERITFYFGAPVSYTAPLQLDVFDTFDLSSVRAWLYGGGPIPPFLRNGSQLAIAATAFYQVYGMTETSPVGTALYPEEQELPRDQSGETPCPASSTVVRADEAMPIVAKPARYGCRTDSKMSDTER